MEIYAQHGSQKGEKIDAGIASHALSGVILSPKDIKESDLTSYIDHLNNQTLVSGNPCRILFDPQFYISHLDQTHRFGHGESYPYFRADLTRADFRSAQKKISLVQECLEYQDNLSIQSILAPTILVEGFSDYFGEIALELCQTSVETYASLSSEKSLVLSVAISESAFTDDVDMAYFLDELSDLRSTVSELYVLFRRTGKGFPAPVSPEIYCRLLYFIDSLVNKNGFEVVVGYSDLFGLGFHALGAKATASGWSQNQKQLTFSQWQPVRGGGPARLRFTSKQLLSQLLVDPELRVISGTEELLEVVLNGNKYDSVFQEPYATWSNAWNQNLSHLNHWLVLKELAMEFSQGTPIENLQLLLKKIDNSLKTWKKLEESGIPLESQASQMRLKELKLGIQTYITNFS